MVIQLASYGATPRCSSASAAWFWVPPSRIVLPAMSPSSNSTCGGASASAGRCRNSARYAVESMGARGWGGAGGGAPRTPPMVRTAAWTVTSGSRAVMA